MYHFDVLKISGPLIERMRAILPDAPKGRKKNLSEEEKMKRREFKKQCNDGFNIPDIEKIESSLMRSKSNIRKIMHANCMQWRDKNNVIIPPRFLTLTFERNITNLSEANRYFTDFIQWLNYEFRTIVIGKIQYICVPEFQKRGAIHYHVIIFNFPYVEKGVDRIRKRWKDRFQLKTMRQHNGIMGMVRYVSKYIAKQATDGRFFGQKRFFHSRGIHKTIVIKNSVANEMICQQIDPYLKNSKSIDINFMGKVLYEAYYLGDKGHLNLPMLDEYSREAIQSAQQK